MRKTLVAGNWKLNGSKDSVKTLVTDLLAGMSEVTDTQVAVCPPYVYIPMVADMLAGSTIAVGSQDNGDQESGAYTGEVSATMLKSVGINTVILGHSKRREFFNETDDLLKQKVDAALENNMQLIFCFGEKLEDRKTNNHFKEKKKNKSTFVIHML